MYVSGSALLTSVGRCVFTTRFLRRTVIVACFALLMSVPGFSQGTRGTIRGIVTDPNGGAVTGANVSLVDVAKQITRDAQTDDSGEYQFVEVEPSTYDIVIQASGFSETRLSEVKVDPNRNLQLDAALAISGTTAEVTVTAAQELINRESAALGTNVDLRTVEGLPLNGRNPLALAGLQPGVTPVAGGGGFRINGSRNVENNITLDGGNNNEVAVGGSVGVQPRPDAVQEFRLLTSAFEAEYGRNTGAVINVVTKSGTNEFHGNARIFYRPTFLSAARFFDQDQPTDRPLSGPGDFRRRFERKEFGGQIGGPIYLPRFGEGGPAFFSGKNKAFFFVDYEGSRQLIGDTRTITNLPTPEERSGIFTARLNPANQLPILLIDPATTSAANPNGTPFQIISGSPTTPGSVVRQQIPTSRFSPIALYYLNFLPVSDASGSASIGADDVTNFDILTTRTDFQIGENQNLSVSFNYADSINSAPFAFGGASVPGFGAAGLRTTFNTIVRHTYSFSPTVVNSLLLNYSRNDQPGVSPDNTTTPSEIGFVPNFVANDTFAGPPRITLVQRGIILGNSIQGPQARVAENFQIQDSLSFVVGDHRLKFGFDGTKYQQDQTFLFINQGILNFSRTTGLNTSGDDLADFLIGSSPASVQFGANGLRDFYQYAGALFAQDSWRASDSLTLSYGLRYEYNSPLRDEADRVAYFREGAVSQLLTSGQLTTPEGLPIRVPAGRTAPVGLVFVGDPDPVLGGTVPRGGVARDLNNFAPRLGIAYSPGTEDGSFSRRLLGDRSTVLRAGFGVYYGAIVGNNVLQQLSAPGFNGTNSFFSPASGTLANPFGPDPFPFFRGNQAQLVNPFDATAVNVFAPLSQFSRAVDPNIRTPYTYQYNATIERGFLNNYVASLSYVGSRGRKLYALQQVNPALGTLIPAPAGRTIPTPTTGNANLRRLNPDIQLGISQAVADGNSFYDSFQANFQRRFTRGLSFQAAYTFSKTISDSDFIDDTLDLFDRRFIRSVSPNDVPHRFVGSFIYELPFARNANGVVRTLVSGFSVGGIYTLQSGTPFSVGNIFDTTGTGGGVFSFADLGAPFQYLDPRQNGNRAFNVDAFREFGAPNANGTFSEIRRGTSGYNQFRAKNGINNFDFILAKKTPLGERANIELRFEAFNAFNHTQFTTLNTNLNNIVRNADGSIDPDRSLFGKFTDAREARVVQLAARFSF